MRITQITMLAAAVLLGSAVSAAAQTVIGAGQAITVGWDAPSMAGVTGYQFETFRQTDAGVVITTTDVPAAFTQATLPASVLPTEGAFLLAVRARYGTVLSERSNALPFVRPEAPTNLRLVPE